MVEYHQADHKTDQEYPERQEPLVRDGVGALVAPQRPPNVPAAIAGLARGAQPAPLVRVPVAL